MRFRCRDDEEEEGQKGAREGHNRVSILICASLGLRIPYICMLSVLMTSRLYDYRALLGFCIDRDLSMLQMLR